MIVVDAQGDLLADSEGTPPGRSYAGRPEIGVALAGRPDQRERRSETLDETLLLTSIPIIVEGRHGRRGARLAVPSTPSTARSGAPSPASS